MASGIFPVPETPYYILPPRRTAFRGLLIVWLMLFVAVFFSFDFFFYMTIPIFLITGYFGYILTKIWRSCGYKTWVYLLLTAVALCVFIAISGPIRSFLFTKLVCMFG